MSSPIVLPTNTTALYRLVLNQLSLDTDPTAGLLAALGQRLPDPPAAQVASGAYSLYPNYSTGGPNLEREKCPVPFVIAYDGGLRATNKQIREARIFLEIHDDPDMGDQRIPGIIKRINYWLLEQEWRPPSDSETLYRAGLTFESRSPLQLIDKRYNTAVVQLSLVCPLVIDRTSNRGYPG